MAFYAPPDDGTDLNIEGAHFGSPFVTSPRWGKRRRLPRYRCSSGEPSLSGVSGLLSQDEVVVLLTALYEQVAVSDELGRGDEVIGAGDLLLVHAHTTRGDELTQLAL